MNSRVSGRQSTQMRVQQGQQALKHNEQDHEQAAEMGVHRGEIMLGVDRVFNLNPPDV